MRKNQTISKSGKIYSYLSVVLILLSLFSGRGSAQTCSVTNFAAMTAAGTCMNQTDFDDFGGVLLMAKCTTKIFLAASSNTPTDCVSRIKMYLFYSNNRADLQNLNTLLTSGAGGLPDFQSIFAKQNVEAVISTTSNSNERLCTATIPSSTSTAAVGIYYRWAKYIDRPNSNPPTVNNVDIMMFDQIRCMRNRPPNVNAGRDTSNVSLANSNSYTLSATGTDDEEIVSRSWTKISGPNCNIGNSTTVSPFRSIVTGLSVGSYVFRFSATDDQGATSTDDVNVTVVSNIPPSVNEGQDETIIVGSTYTARGSATDRDGTIASVKWSAFSTNPRATNISSPNNLTTQITGFSSAGVYTFGFEATDNLGAKSNASLQLTVVTASPPTVSAGSNTTITLPTNSVSLSGTATASAGTTISTTTWSQISGPNTAAISNGNTLNPRMSNLNVGTYVFKLTATNNVGLSACATVTVTVNNGPVGSTGGGSTTPTTPDLAVVVFNSAFDGSVPNSFHNVCIQAGDPNPKITTIPPLTVTISELNGVAVNRSFVVRISKNGVTRDTTIASLGASQSITINLNSTRLTANGTRESRVCATKSTTNAAVCLRCADGISGVNYWDDRGISVTVDATSQINEGTNESNNIKSIP